MLWFVDLFIMIIYFDSIDVFCRVHFFKNVFLSWILSLVPTLK